jgi:hypothetical protein
MKITKLTTNQTQPMLNRLFGFNDFIEFNDFKSILQKTDRIFFHLELGWWTTAGKSFLYDKSPDLSGNLHQIKRPI